MLPSSVFWADFCSCFSCLFCFLKPITYSLYLYPKPILAVSTEGQVHNCHYPAAAARVLTLSIKTAFHSALSLRIRNTHLLVSPFDGVGNQITAFNFRTREGRRKKDSFFHSSLPASLRRIGTPQWSLHTDGRRVNFRPESRDLKHQLGQTAVSRDTKFVKLHT